MQQQVVTFLLGEVPRDVRGEVFPPVQAKSAPGYTQKAMPQQVVIGKESAVIAGREVEFHIGGYPPEILMIRARMDVDNIFQKDVFDLEHGLFEQNRKIFQTYGGNLQYCEEYSVFTVAGYQGKPEQFLQHGDLIAGLLKSERMELDKREVDYTLRSQIKYGLNDMSIIDWDGAFLFDQDGKFDEDIELLMLGNLQLLRHRILDRQLDSRLEHVAGLVEKPFRGQPAFRSKELGRDLMKVVQSRMHSISEMQRLDRDIKLIGDWYSARLFDLVTDKFKIDDWRESILSKLDLLEDIYSIVAENFAVSWKSRAEWVQIILFFILQAFWFLLIFLEFKGLH